MKKITYILILLVTFQGCKETTEKDTSEIASEASVASESQVILKILSPQEFEAKIGLDSLSQLVDVRTVEEYNDGHLSFATNYSITDEDFQKNAVSLVKERPVYVYCKSGGRSARASKLLVDLGFTQVYDLQGGITAWQAAGLPVVK
ncbi:rhodanese-related sulfurtransferase [Ulvibacter sp. MAR_2010_11]|uniref:rhodanese-like domain-containing protein n=1 Tax=Ulvibacter sp. MAR_2010_11 TaxID=1250229 RepID=UPI000C2CC1C7|nr:rhodanese-like domain-containing protein [Ulvibacter sp. MAR_2010_11]PKA83585.1 rhodanese-related sulfurtransferase [Ulvibacter sp. MAR_2010_11]